LKCLFREDNLKGKAKRREHTMRIGIKRVWILMILCIALTLVAYSCGGESEHGKTEEGKEHSMEMGHEGRHAEGIRKAEVEGHEFAYELIDIAAKMEAKEGVDMSQMKSHHMMLYISKPDGKAVSDAKVGFKVIGPDGSEQKVMTMAMGAGYGADVDLKVSGTYQIATKAVVGGKDLIDKFSYEVE
jgi:hypothetical protein